jgi:hypothetical protein
MTGLRNETLEVRTATLDMAGARLPYDIREAGATEVTPEERADVRSMAVDWMRSPARSSGRTGLMFSTTT